MLSDIRIYYECESKIEKPIRRIAVWHHETCRVTNGDPKVRIFLSYLYMYNGFTFLLTTGFIYLFIYLFIYIFIYLFQNELAKVPEYAKMIHVTTLLDALG